MSKVALLTGLSFLLVLGACGPKPSSQPLPEVVQQSDSAFVKDLAHAYQFCAFLTATGSASDAKLISAGFSKRDNGKYWLLSQQAGAFVTPKNKRGRCVVDVKPERPLLDASPLSAQGLAEAISSSSQISLVSRENGFIILNVKGVIVGLSLTKERFQGVFYTTTSFAKSN